MFEDFQKLEKELRVEDIRVNGIQIWPVLRIYLADQVVFKKDRTVKPDGGVMKGALQYFFYGFSNFFKSTNTIFFSSSDQRKKVGDQFIDRADIVSELLPKLTIVELPSKARHFNQKVIPASSSVVSKYPFYIITWLLAKLSGPFNVECEDILKDFMQKAELRLNYQWHIRLFFAQRKFMSRFIKWKKIKSFLLITPYTNMGYVYEAKSRGLSVVEFQHGTLNKSHFAYNINKAFDANFYPDKLLTFGMEELNTFDESNHYIDRSNVHPLGSFIIDFIVRNGVQDEKFEAITSKYKRSVAFAAQDALEEFYIDEFKSIALKDTETCYIMMPRHQPISYYDQFDFPENVVFIPWLTTYEIVYLSDFHSTINSTTAAEAPSLGTPNILLNIQNRAKDYWEGILDKEICVFADDADDFVHVLNNFKTISREAVMEKNKNIIVPGFRENLKAVLPKLNL